MNGGLDWNFENWKKIIALGIVVMFLQPLQMFFCDLSGQIFPPGLMVWWVSRECHEYVMLAGYNTPYSKNHKLHTCSIYKKKKIHCLLSAERASAAEGY